jgi:hypothetical protein
MTNTSTQNKQDLMYQNTDLCILEPINLSMEIDLLQSKINSLTCKAIKENGFMKYGNILTQLQNQLNTLKTKSI